MKCIFDIYNYTNYGGSHLAQFGETRTGKRSPLVKNKRAIIREKDGLYYGEINGGQVIAISDDVKTVYDRLKRADRNLSIAIRHNNRNFRSIEAYYNAKLPRIYRLAYSTAGGLGLIIAIDDFKGGENSSIRLFYDVDKLVDYIKRRQRGNDEFYVHGRQPRDDFREQVGSILAFDVPRELRNIEHLQQTIKERQSLKRRRLNEQEQATSEKKTKQETQATA